MSSKNFTSKRWMRTKTYLVIKEVLDNNSNLTAVAYSRWIAVLKAVADAWGM